VLVEQHLPEHEQVVEVHRVRIALALLVAAEDVHHLVAVHHEVRVVLLEVQLQRRAGVDQVGIDVEQHVAFREALLERLDAEGGDGGLHRLLGVFGVENREAAAIADGVRVAAEQAVADRVKRAAPDAARVDGDELLDAAEHLPRRFVRERDDEDVGRIDAVFDEPRHAIGERPRFAAARPGDDEHRPVAGHDHLELFRIELIFVRDAVLFLRFLRRLENVFADLRGHSGEFIPREDGGSSKPRVRARYRTISRSGNGQRRPTIGHPAHAAGLRAARNA
jgi:hypothetical protein